MAQRYWLKDLARKWFGARARKTKPTPTSRPTARRLAVEGLEERVVPAWDVTIVSGVGTILPSASGVFTATGAGSTVSVNDIQTQFALGNDVTINNGFLGFEAGNIRWTDPADLNYAGGGTRTITILNNSADPTQRIIFDPGVNIQATASSTLNLDWNAATAIELADDTIIDLGPGSVFTLGADVTVNDFLGGSSANIFADQVDLNGATRTFTTVGGPDALVVGAGIVGNAELIKAGAGRLDFVGNLDNTYSGVTTVNDGQLTLDKPGVIAVSGDLVIGDGVNLLATVSLRQAEQISDTSDVFIDTDGILEFNSGLAMAETIDELAGMGVVRNVTGNPATLVVGADNGSADFAGDIGPAVDAITVTKIGSGTQTLSGGSNGYTGVTNINGGTLVVTGYLGILGGAVNVNNGSTLAGTGLIDRQVNVVDGTLDPGVGIGSFLVRDIVILADGSLDIQIDGTAAFDQLNIDTNADLGAGTLNLTGTHIFTPGLPLTILSSINLVSQFSNAPDGSTLLFNGQPVLVTYNFPGTIELTYDPTPVINTGAGNDHIDVYVSGLNLVVEVNSNVVLDTAIANLSSLTINAGDGNDLMVLDRTGLAGPLPPITFNGEGQGPLGDELVVMGGPPIGNLTYTTIDDPINFEPRAGELDIDGSVITFTGLEPVNVISPIAGTVQIDLDAAPGTPITANIVDDAPGMMRVDIVGFPAESMTFAIPGTLLRINGDADNTNTINFNSVDASFAAAIEVNGGGLADEVNFNTDLNLGAGAATGNIVVNSNVEQVNIASLVDIDTTGGTTDGSVTFITAGVDIGAASTLNLGAGTLQLGPSVTMDSLLDGTSTITAASTQFAGGPATILIDAAKTLDIIGDLAATGLTKTGAGTLRFSGGVGAGNTPGDVFVDDGVLELNKSGGLLAILGNLFIGDNVGGAGSAVVRLLNDEQIFETFNTQFGSDGLFDLNGFDETVGTITALDSTAEITNLSTLPGSPSVLTVGAGDFGGVLSDGPVNTLGLVKQSLGTLTLSGSLANTFTGTTDVNAGVLELDKTGVNAIGGDLDVLAGNVILLGGDEQIADTSDVTVDASLDLNGFNETIDGLFGGPGGLITNTGTSTLSVGADDGSSTFAGSIINGTGLTSLTKLGAGVFTVSGFNSYTGATSIVAGTIRLGNDVRLSNQTDVDIASGAVFDLNGFSQLIDALSGAGTVTNSQAATLSAIFVGGDDGSGDFSGVIQDGAGAVLFAKAGLGTQTLSGSAANTYSGPTTVAAGILELNKSPGVNAISGMDLSIGDGAAPTGNLRLLAANQISDATNVLVDGDGIFDLNGFNEAVGELSGIGVITNDGAAEATLTVDFNVGSSTFNGQLQDGTGTLAFTKDGTGQQFLQGPGNSHTGVTTVNQGLLVLNTAGDGIGGNLVIGDGAGVPGDAVVQLGVSEQVPDTSDVYINADGRLDLNGNNETIDELSGTGVVTSASAALFTLGFDNGDADFGGDIQVNVALRKIGAGTQTLSGTNNDYTGDTDINGGTLEVTGILQNSPGRVFVNSGALTGNGTINRLVDNASVLAPGVDLVDPTDTLVVDDILFTGGTLEIDIDGVASGLHDLLFVNFTADLAASTLALAGSHVFAPGESIQIVTAGANVIGEFANAPDGSFLFFNGQPVQITYNLADVTLSYNPDVVIDAGAGNDDIEVYRNGTNVVVEVNSVVMLDTAVVGVNSLTINGGLGDDTLTVDLAGGDPIPVGGIFFDGQDPIVPTGDQLIVTGGSIDELTYFADGTQQGAGVLDLDGSIINFTGLEPVAVNSALGTVTIDIDGAGGAVTANITNNGAAGDGVMAVELPAPFEPTMTFTTPTVALIVNGDSVQADTISVLSVDDDFQAALTINGRGGVDEVFLDADLTLGSASSTGDVVVIAETLNVRADIDTTGAAFAGDMTFAVGALNLDDDVDLNLGTGATGGTVTLGSDVTVVNSGGPSTATITARHVDLDGATRTFTVDDVDDNLVVTAQIVGNLVGVAKDGDGALTLGGSTANLYTGVTQVDEGVLILNKTGVNAVIGDLVIGDGAGVLAATVLLQSDQISDTSDVSLASEGVFDLFLAASETIDELSGVAGANVTSTSIAATLTVGADDGSADFAGIIDEFLTGALALTKIGSGTQTLSGASANTFTGDTNVNAGVLALNKTAGVDAIAASLFINAGGTVRLLAADQIADASPVTVDGTLDLNGSNEAVNALDGTGLVTNGSGTASTLTVGVGNFGGVLEDGAGGLGLVKDGAGTLVLSGTAANTFTGLTDVVDGTLVLQKTAGVDALGGNLLIRAAGEVDLANDEQIPDASDVEIETNGVLDLDGSDETIDELSGSGTVTNSSIIGAAELTVGAGDGSSLFAGVIEDGATNDTSLTKIGLGTQTFSGTNTYTGDTNIDAGVLSVIGSLAAGSTVEINAGGTLAGTGDVFGTVNVNFDGTIDPGVTTGTLNVGVVGSFTDGIFSVQIDGTGAGQFDRLAVTGNADLTGGFLDLTGIHVFGALDPNVIILTAGNLIGEFANAPDGSFLNLNGQPVQISYSATDVVLSFNPDLVINTGTGNDVIDVFRVGANVVVEVNNVVFLDTALAGVDSLTINGEDGDDTLTVDLSGGDPTPANGLFFNGDADADEMFITGGSIGSLTYETRNNGVDPVNAGALDLDGSAITFTGLEPVTITSALGTVTIDVNDAIGVAPITTTISDNATPGLMDVDFVGFPAESMTFSVPDVALVINGDPNQQNIVDIDSVDPSFAAALTIDLPGLTDIVNLNSSLALGSALSTGNVTVIADAVNVAAGVVISTTGAALDGDILFAANTIDLADGAALNLGTSAAGGTLTLGGNVSSGLAQINARAVDLGSSARTFTVGAGDALNIDARLENGGVVKLGDGALRFLGVNGNIYASNTVVNAGTLALAKASGVDAVAGDLIINAGGLVQLEADEQINDSSAVAVNGTGQLDLNDFVETIDVLTGTGTVTNTTGDATLSVGSAGSSFTFAGVIQNGGGTGTTLNKLGTGVFTISGANAYTGDTNILDGTLRLGGSERLANGSTVDVSAGATFDLNGNSETIAVLDGAGLVTSSVAGSVVLILNGGAVGSFSGVIQDGSGSVALTVNGGTQILSGSNTYTGPTTISAGTLQLGASDVLASTNDVAVDGSLDLNGFDLTIDELSGAGTVTNSGAADSTLTVGADDGSADFSGVIQDGGTNDTFLTKIGDGTQTLSGNNTFTGLATVDAGTLRVTGSLDSDVQVNGFATLNVEGAGSLDALSTTTVDAFGRITGTGTAGMVDVGFAGIVDPGLVTGTLVAAQADFDTDALLFIEINGVAGGTFDHLDVTGGAVDLDADTLGGALLVLSGSHVFAPGDAIDILTYASLAGAFANAPDGSTLFFNGQPLVVSYGTGTNDAISLAYNADPVINTGGGDDDIVVFRSGLNLVVEVNSVVVLDTPYAPINSLEINSEGGDDTLTVDLSFGDPIPVAGGIDFDGGADTDELFITGGAIDNLLYNATGAGTGNLDLDGSVITFTGLEPVTVDSNLGTVEITIDTALAGPFTTNITDGGDPGDGLMTVELEAPLESMNFSVPTVELIINGDPDADNIINVDSVDDSFAAALTINATGTGTDEVNLNADLTLGSIDATGDLFADADTVNVNNAVDTQGTITINVATELNVAAAGDLFAGGPFSQTGAGTVDLAGDIDADGISFASSVTLTDDVLLVSSADVIFLGGLVGNADGTRSIELDALGNISFQQVGGVGVRPLDIVITQAADVDFNGTVDTAGGIEQVAGTGTTSFLDVASIGGLLLVTTNEIVVQAPVTTVGPVGLTALDNVLVNADIDAGASTILIHANQDDDGVGIFDQDLGTTISTTSEADDAITVVVNQATGGGTAQLAALAAGTATGVVTVNANGGDVFNNEPGATNVTAFRGVLAGALIGDPLGDPITTSVAQLNLTALDEIFLTNDSAALELTGLNTLAGSASIIDISTTGTLDVSGSDGYSGLLDDDLFFSSVGDMTILGAPLAANDLSLTATSVQVDLGADLTIGNDLFISAQDLIDSASILVTVGNLLDIDLSGTGLLDEAVIDGTGSLVKNGTGLLELATGNTYSGGTDVNDDGTLLVTNATGSATGSGAVNVNDAAALFGTGFISGAVTLFDTSTAEPGPTGGTPGILSVGPVDFQDTSEYVVDIDGTTPGAGGYDQLVASDVAIGATATIDLQDSITPPAGSVLILIDNVGLDPISGAFANLTEGQTVNLGGQDMIATYLGGDGNDLALVGVGAWNVTGFGDFVLQLNADEATILELLLNGSVIDSRPISAVDSFQLTTNGANPGEDSTFTVDFTNGFFTLPGDIDFVGSGDPDVTDRLLIDDDSFADVDVTYDNATDGTITLDVDGLGVDQTVTYSNVEVSGALPAVDLSTLTITDLTMQLPSVDNVITLNEPVFNGTLQIFGSTIAATQFSVFTNMTLLGGAADDELTIDYLGHSVGPIPTAGFLFDGGAENTGDSLIVTDSTDTLQFDSLTYNAVADGTGTGDLVIDGETISFTGLEPVTVLPTASVVTINIDGADPKDIDIENAAAAGYMTVSEPMIESLEFAVPTEELIINGDADTDNTISVLTVDPTFDAALTINSPGASIDDVIINADLTLGSADSTGDVFIVADSLTLNGSIDTTGATPAGDVALNVNDVFLADDASLNLGTGFNGGTLFLGGDVTVTDTAGANLATITARTVMLGSANRTFNVFDGDATLDIDAEITGTGVGVVKNGPGTLSYSGVDTNTYTGSTQVNDGTLQLNKTGVHAITGNLVIGNESVLPVPDSAIVELLQSDQINEDASVLIRGDGLLDLSVAAVSETLNDLTIIGGEVRIGAGSTLVLGINGTLRGTSLLSQSAEITGDGTLDLGIVSNTIIVDDGFLTNDLIISAATIGVGLTKDGFGTLQFLDTTIDLEGSFRNLEGTTQLAGITTMFLTGNFENFPSATFDGGTASTVNFDGAVAQTVILNDNGPDFFFNLVHSGTGTLQVLDTLDINGDFANSNAPSLGGVFDLNGQTMFVAGSFYNDGDADFVANGGLVVLDGVNPATQLIEMNGDALFDLTHSGTSLVVVQDTLDVDNDFDNQAGEFDLNGQTMLVGGDFTNALAADFTHSNGLVNLDGTDTQALTMNGDPLFNLTHSGASAVTVFGDLDVDNNFTNSAGTFGFDAPAAVMTVGADFLNAGGTFSAPDQLFVAGHFINTATFTHNDGIVDLNGTGTQDLQMSGASFFNLTHSGTSTVNVLDAIDVDNDFDNQAGVFDLNGEILRVAGNFTNVGGGSFDADGGLVDLDGASGVDQLLDMGGDSLFNLTHSGASTAHVVEATLDVDNNFINSDGSFVFDMTSALMTVAGNFQNTAAFDANGGTVDLDGVDPAVQLLQMSGASFFNLTHSGDSTVSVLDTIDVDNDFDNQAGVFDLNGQILRVAGDFTNVGGGSFDADGGLVDLDGATGDQFLTMGADALFDLTHSGASTVHVVDAALEVENDFINNDGSFVFDVVAATMNVGGDFLNSAGFDANSGTVFLDGAALTTQLLAMGAASFFNLTHNGGSTVEVVNTPEIINVDGAFNNLAGEFDLNGQKLEVAGDFFNSATFTGNGGEVELDGASAQLLTAGGANFSDLTQSNDTSVTAQDPVDVASIFLLRNGGTFDIGGNSLSADTLTLENGTIQNGDITVATLYELFLGSISADMHGTATATKDTVDLVSLSGTDDYDGPTTIVEGTLSIDAPGSLTSDIIVEDGGTLAGGSNTTGVGTTGTVTVQDGGTLAPGASPAILDGGASEFQAGSIFHVEIDGEVPGDDYDRFNLPNAADTVTISGNAVLTVDFAFQPLTNTVSTFIIINNDGSDAVILPDGFGFNGLAEGEFVGTVLDSAGITRNVLISYVAGTNSNDVALIVDAVDPVISDVSANPDPFAPNNPTTISYTISEDAAVTVEVYNSSNQLVITLVDADQLAGVNTTQWNGQNLGGQVQPNGAYEVRINATDMAGNDAVEQTITITLQAVPPPLPSLAESLAANRAYTVVGATGSPTSILAVKIFDSTGNFVSSVQPFGNTTSLRVATGDFDGDGIVDEFAVLGRLQSADPSVNFRGQIVTYDLDASGNATETGRFFAFAPGVLGNGFITAGDFDGDGDDDLAVAQIGGGNNFVTMQLHVNNGGTFTPGGAVPINFGVVSAPRIAAGDTDGDGFDEIVMAARTPSGARVLVFDATDPSQAPTQQGAGFTWTFGIDGYDRGAFVAVGEFDPTFAGAEIVLGSNVGGGGRVDIVSFNGDATATLSENGRLTPFGDGYNAAVRVAVGQIADRISQPVLLVGQDRFQSGQMDILARAYSVTVAPQPENPVFESVAPTTVLTDADGQAPGGGVLGPFLAFANTGLVGAFPSDTGTVGANSTGVFQFNGGSLALPEEAGFADPDNRIFVGVNLAGNDLSDVDLFLRAGGQTEQLVNANLNPTATALDVQFGDELAFDAQPDANGLLFGFYSAVDTLDDFFTQGTITSLNNTWELIITNNTGSTVNLIDWDLFFAFDV